jgi:hypothetical protein
LFLVRSRYIIFITHNSNHILNDFAGIQSMTNTMTHNGVFLCTACMMYSFTWKYYFIPWQAGLILWQGYISGKHCATQTQNSHLKLYFQGVRGLTASSCIVYDYTTSGHRGL